MAAVLKKNNCLYFTRKNKVNSDVDGFKIFVKYFILTKCLITLKSIFHTHLVKWKSRISEFGEFDKDLRSVRLCVGSWQTLRWSHVNVGWYVTTTEGN